MAAHPAVNVVDDAEEDETEEAGGVAVFLAVEAASERLQELVDDVIIRLHSVTEAALRGEFENARDRAIRSFERLIVAAGFEDDDLDVVQGREEVEGKAAEMWDRIQGHNNLLKQQELQELHLQGKELHQAAFVARTDPTSQQETMQRVLEAKNITKLAGSTVAPKTADGKSSSGSSNPSAAKHGNEVQLVLTEAEREWKLELAEKRKEERMNVEKQRASYLALAAKEEKKLIKLQKPQWLLWLRRGAIQSAEDGRKLYLDLAAAQDKWLAADEAQHGAAPSSARSPATTTTTAVAGLTRLTAGLTIGGSAAEATSSIVTAVAATTNSTNSSAGAAAATTTSSAGTSSGGASANGDTVTPATDPGAAVATPSSKTRNEGLDDSGVRSPECA